MKKFLMAAVGAAALVGVSGTASAAPLSLSWGFVPLGVITIQPGLDIGAANTSITLPGSQSINTIVLADAANALLAGIALGGGVTVTPLILPMAIGALIPNVVVTAGLLTYTFTSEVSLSQFATAAGPIAGNIAFSFAGSITADGSVGAGFLNQTASLSGSCTQTAPGSSTNCSFTVDTPSSIREVPEPATLALLGAGLAGLGLVRRRRA